MVVWAGCAGTATPENPSNGALGISELWVDETSERTTIVALDADQRPVGRLELVHGRFASTEEPAMGVVEGRRLSVLIHGQTLEWETIGFTDTRHMPALPPSLDAVAAFVADDRVRPILDRWRIGWQGAPALAVALAAIAGDCYHTFKGTNAKACTPGGASGLLCALRQGNTAACSGGQALEGVVVSDDGAASGWNQDIVSMCCRNPIDGAYLHAVKTCMIGTTNKGPDGQACPAGRFCSECGESANKCKPCYTIPTSEGGCHVSTQDAGTSNHVGLPEFLS